MCYKGVCNELLKAKRIANAFYILLLYACIRLQYKSHIEWVGF